MKREEKLLLLQCIKERKDILFGAFCNVITKDKKRESWEEIVGILKANGITYTKDAAYLRDTTWVNMKRATMVR
jgi:hypothetical protein